MDNRYPDHDRKVDDTPLMKGESNTNSHQYFPIPRALSRSAAQMQSDPRMTALTPSKKLGKVSLKRQPMNSIKPKLGLPPRSGDKGQQALSPLYAAPPANVQTLEQMHIVTTPIVSSEKSEAVHRKKKLEDFQEIDVEKSDIVAHHVDRHIEQIMTMQMPAMDSVAATGDSLVLQTVSIQTVSKKRTQKKAKAFFSSILLFILGLLFMAAIVAFIIFSTYPIIKIAASIVLIIMASHVLSLQVKRFYTIKHEKYLSSTQLMQAVNKNGIKNKSGEEEEMGHMKLIKQDTTVYLQALRIKDMKKGV